MPGVPNELFVQLDELYDLGEEEVEWREAARWMRYEENLEPGAERWGKPHVSSLSFQSLLTLRSLIEKCSIVLDLEQASSDDDFFAQITDTILKKMLQDNQILPDDEEILDWLLQSRHHPVVESSFEIILKNQPHLNSLGQFYYRQFNSQEVMSLELAEGHTPNKRHRLQRQATVGSREQLKRGASFQEHAKSREKRSSSWGDPLPTIREGWSEGKESSAKFTPEGGKRKYPVGVARSVPICSSEPLPPIEEEPTAEHGSSVVLKLSPLTKDPDEPVKGKKKKKHALVTRLPSGTRGNSSVEDVDGESKIPDGAALKSIKRGRKIYIIPQDSSIHDHMVSTNSGGLPASQAVPPTTASTPPAAQAIPPAPVSIPPAPHGVPPAPQAVPPGPQAIPPAPQAIPPASQAIPQAPQAGSPAIPPTNQSVSPIPQFGLEDEEEEEDEEFPSLDGLMNRFSRNSTPDRHVSPEVIVLGSGMNLGNPLLFALDELRDSLPPSRVFEVTNRAEALPQFIQYMRSEGVAVNPMLKMEKAIDAGGPSKTFCSLLMLQLRQWKGFRGEQRKLIPGYNFGMQLNSEYYFKGASVGHILLKGQSCCIFADLLIEMITDTAEPTLDDIPDPVIKEALLDPHNSKYVDVIGDLRNEMDFSGTSMEELKSLAVTYLCKVKNKESWRQFLQGLEDTGVLPLLKQYPGEARKLLCGSKEREVTADAIIENTRFKFHNSSEEPLLRQREELHYSWFLEYLHNIVRSPEGEYHGVTLRKVVYAFTGQLGIPEAGIYPKIAIEFKAVDGWTGHDCWNGWDGPLCETYEKFEDFIDFHCGIEIEKDSYGDN